MKINFTKMGLKFIMTQVFLFSLLFILGNNNVISKNLNFEIKNLQKMEASFELEIQTLINDENSWTLAFSDEKIKVYLQRMNCDGKDSYKLKIVNLTSNEVSFSYKLWDNVDVKKIVLTPFANVEGICSAGYGYKLIEEIPKSLKTAKTNLTIVYLPK